MPRRRTSLPLLYAFVGGLGLGPPANSTAAPPRIDALYPAGARQGTIVLVTAEGAFERWPPERVWTDGRGLTARPAEAKGRFWLSTEELAEPGLHWLRCGDAEGATGLRPFLIGRLPEVNEREPNDTLAQSQPLGHDAIVVNGRLGMRDDVDGFALGLRQGQTLVATLEANRELGAPIDGILQVVGPEGFVLAENDDDRGLDPSLVVTVPADGAYTVRTFGFPSTPGTQIGFTGGPLDVYRLTVTTAGFVDHAYPLAVAGSAPASVRLEGWNLPARDWGTVFHPRPGEGQTIGVPLVRGVAGRAEVRAVGHAAVEEVEPNSPDHPQAVHPPVSVSGRIEVGEDRDAFAFQAKAGASLRVEVASRIIGQPLDAVLEILDATGAVVAEADDEGEQRDPGLTFKAPASGTFRAVVSDLNKQGGMRSVYLLTLTAPIPDVRLTVAADKFALTAGGEPLALPVTVTRVEGFAEPLTVEATDLPPGVSAQVETSQPSGSTASAVTLKLRADPGAQSGSFRIVGQTAGTPPRLIEARGPVSKAGPTTSWLWLTPSLPKPAPKPR